ncbi:MAG: FAD-dependent oxidoreductase, partial [Actinomycetota bacterium]
ATMYLSGRPLHAVTTNLALKISEQYQGRMLLSFAGGADCFNVPELLRSGLTTVTVCSDLLKSGGYLRMLQYFETLEAAMEAAGAADLADYTVKTSAGGGDPAAAGLANLREYAVRVRTEPRMHKMAIDTAHSKTPRPLGLFDCIEAPCVDECPVDQAVPQYMEAVRTGDYAAAVALTRSDNPMPAILGHVCDHLCEHTCIRTHYDEPLAIREIKRFIMSREVDPAEVAAFKGKPAVAVIGAGPCGLAAAGRLAQAGHPVTVFEMHPYAGGMVGGAIPSYRLPQAVIDQDLAPLRRLGVEFRFGQQAGTDFTLADLRSEGFGDGVVAVGAQLAKRLGLDGEDAAGVIDGIAFLRSVREGNPVEIGSKVAVIGAGDTAMDCARSAARLGAEVTVVYRRSIDQMPADREEVRALLDEGIRVEELAKPVRLVVEDGALAGIECLRMEYRGDRDSGGRKIPHEVGGSEFVLEFDTMLVAVSQHSVLDFFGEAVPELTGRGHLATDPVTLQTSIPGIYAGGDAAAGGPASIVKAAADGKAIAAAISGVHATPPAPHQPPADWVGLLGRRAHREWRRPVPHLPVAEREGFRPVVLTLSEDEARREASRCLDCQTMCSICVGVCPNLAILTYRSAPLDITLPVLSISGAEVTSDGSEAYRVGQQLQVAVLTDFCNECGNCETFCPTAGVPYRDKPRLYLDRGDFEAQSDNAFMVFRGDTPAIEGRFGGETHRIESNGSLTYRAPGLTATIDPATWEILDARGDAAGEVSLRSAADLYVLLTGMSTSAPQLPGAGPGTRIGHPGYPD